MPAHGDRASEPASARSLTWSTSGPTSCAVHRVLGSWRTQAAGPVGQMGRLAPVPVDVVPHAQVVGTGVLVAEVRTAHALLSEGRAQAAGCGTAREREEWVEHFALSHSSKQLRRDQRLQEIVGFADRPPGRVRRDGRQRRRPKQVALARSKDASMSTRSGPAAPDATAVSPARPLRSCPDRRSPLSAAGPTTPAARKSSPRAPARPTSPPTIHTPEQIEP